MSTGFGRTVPDRLTLSESRFREIHESVGPVAPGRTAGSPGAVPASVAERTGGGQPAPASPAAARGSHPRPSAPSHASKVSSPG